MIKRGSITELAEVIAVVLIWEESRIRFLGISNLIVPGTSGSVKPMKVSENKYLPLVELIENSSS